MDWQARMTEGIKYIETNLRGEVDFDQAAEKANCSPFHFLRMFDVITGMSPAEYSRRRRLTLAANDLCRSGERVIDVALRYGYDSPDSFSRAFKREFGLLPSEARQPGVILHAYPPLQFTVVLKGVNAMEYRIEPGKEMKLVGYSERIHTKNGENFKMVPAFWDRITQEGLVNTLCKLTTPNSLGVLGVCHDFDKKTGDFTYSIAVEATLADSPLPPGVETFTVPASTWGKFTSRGPIRPNFQDTIKRIFGEWFPASGWEHAGTAEIEFYPEGDCESQDYHCEYWVPLINPNAK
jgi:AraC family transcriptional regulator